MGGKTTAKDVGLGIVTGGAYNTSKAATDQGKKLGKELLPGAKKIDSMSIPQSLQEAEQQTYQRQAAIASGTSPSIAQMQLNQANQQASQQALAMAASQRGASNPALAFRQAQIGNQQMGLENAQAGAIMAEQERRAADQLIAQQAAAARGVSLQAGIANQQAQTAQRAQNMQLISGIGTTAAAASDERVKEDIRPASGSADEIEAFLGALKGYDYKYKDSKHGTGDKTGIMAQDLEKSKIGKTMVDQAPDGTKMVDTNKAIGAILAGMADLNKKIKKMES